MSLSVALRGCMRTRGAPSGSADVHILNNTHRGMMLDHYQRVGPSQPKETACVVPPVAAAVERPPGAAAVCMSTPSCPRSHPRSDAPAPPSSGPCGGSRGAVSDAREAPARTRTRQTPIAAGESTNGTGQPPGSLTGEQFLAAVGRRGRTVSVRQGRHHRPLEVGARHEPGPKLHACIR